MLLRTETYVFAYDLLQRMCQYLPRKNFDVLFDVARLRIRECHDDLEEILAVFLAFRDSQRAKSFQVPADSVLFLDRETNVH